MLIRNGSSSQLSGKIVLSAKSFNSRTTDQTQVITGKFTAAKSGQTAVELELPFSEQMQTWDEFNPALYKLSAKLIAKNYIAEKEIQFGMREFKIEGNKFLVNGRPVFLRGTLHNGEAPLTG